jgi:hypothetical protein
MSKLRSTFLRRSHRRTLTLSVWLASSTLAGVVLVAREATAVEASSAADSGPPSRRHLLQATARGGAAWIGGDLDSRYPQTGPYWGAGVGYSLATRGVDFGVAFDYLAAPHSKFPRHALVPALSLRFHLPLTATTEFGLELRGGWSWVTLRNYLEDSGDERDHTFSGLHLGLAPHARLWTSPRFALDLGGELLLAGGGDSMTSAGVRSTQLERSARIATAGVFVRGSFGL